ncbi:MAG: hypothetical protein KDA50_06490 [Rhodobacteraceae bacterium]|nr:hypothetical protein [Paracoccaceae bacterium]
MNLSPIVAAHPACLRNPVLFQVFALFFFERTDSANMVRDLITASIWDWHADGGKIVTSRREELDIGRMETLGEAYVYSTKGKAIYLEPGIVLTRLDDSFGENTRRTLNRMKEKLKNPCTQRVDKRLLPLMFWMDVARKIIEFQVDD